MKFIFAIIEFLRNNIFALERTQRGRDHLVNEVFRDGRGRGGVAAGDLKLSFRRTFGVFKFFIGTLRKKPSGGRKNF